ncbi:terminase small subunit [Lacticaseibacillus paracasei]|uniref:terminase small subunit n=1 Tax=Lacticaseibacillus paracasei TaxID=1597 RepID=UPI0039943876
MKLSPKQQAFADNFIKSGNKYQSAIEAGYSKNYARSHAKKLSENVGIKSYIAERMKRLESDKIAKAAEVLQYFTTVLRGEAKETIIVSTPDGADAVENEPSIKDRMSAGKELLKRYPADDRMLGAQIKKLEAEADIMAAKAKRETSEDTSNITINIKPIQQDGGDDSAD